MFSSPGRYIALMLLCAAIALPLRSEETPASKQPVAPKASGADKKTDKKSMPGPMPSADSKKNIDLKSLDLTSLPTDAVLIICERAAEALQMVPNAVILTPSKYQEMRDEIERLRKMLQIDKPVAPSRCELKGRVEESAVILEAEFQGSTERPNTLVTLACPQAGAASAQLDGQVPLIRRGDSGFLVQIEKAGPYHLKLNLFVPLTTRENSRRGFDLTLPQAAITRLDLELPANSKDVRVGGRPLGDPELAGLALKNPHHLSGNPSSSRAVDKLDVNWKEARPPSGVPVLIADGKIQVRLDPSGLTTEADLTLRIEGAPTNVWKLLVPPNSEVTVEDARVKQPIATEKQQFAWLRTLQLKEASADPLKVHVKVHSPLPRGGMVVPVGPFFVLGAARQTGTVVVRNQVRTLYLYYPERPGVKPQPRTEELGGDTAVEVAAFSYSNIPMVEKPQGPTGRNSLSWIDLDVETVRGQVRTRVSHNLRLRLDSDRPSLHWDILTTISPATKWSDIEQLKVVVPPEWSPTDDNTVVGSDKDARVVTYRSRVLRQGQTQPLPGRYELDAKVEGRATLMLPRPQGFIEQCDVKIEGPADSEIVLHNAEQAGLEPVPVKQSRPNEQLWRCRNVPKDWPALDVSWRPYRPEVPATSVADVTLNGNRAVIRHEILLHLPQAPPSSLDLRVPPAVADSLNIRASGKLQRVQDASVAGPGVVRFAVPPGVGGSDCRLMLEYTAILRGDRDAPVGPQEPFTIPLAFLEQTQGGIKVRVWSGPNSLPQSASGSPWEEGRIEEVKDRPDLPVLVLRSPRAAAPLVLRSREEETVYTVLVERALVRVQLQEDGRQVYRASFQLRQLADKYLDVKLPGPAGAPNVHIAFNHQKVTPVIVNELGQPTEGGDVARLRLPLNPVRQTALLDVSYVLRPGGSGGPMRTTLQPPILRGAPPAVPTRWLVTVPSHRVLIAPESAAGLERTWMRRGWLLAARIHRSVADLEREFEQSLPEALRSPSENNQDEASQAPALVCWQDSVEPLTLTHAPQQAWLLVCSLGLLVLGLGLYWTARPRTSDGGRMSAWFWPLLALATLGAMVGVLLWPTTFWAIVYGCEPGALVLICVLALQWLMHQRYRRQIVFLPSFSRGRAGSSLLRKSSAHRQPNGEPSTVDAPPPAAG